MLALLLQVDTLHTQFERYGSFGIVLMLLVFAIIYLAKKNDTLEKDNKIMAEKSVEALTLANKVIDESQANEKDTREALDKLRMQVLTSSCKYENKG